MRCWRWMKCWMARNLANGATFTTGNLGFTQASPKDVVENTLLWGGEMRLTLDVFRDLGSAFIVALILIYLMLVGYYKSFGLPVIVMGAIPLTLVGVFPGHWATDQAFTATSMIGVIALAGIVVRNSLLLIDFILDYRKQGYDLEQAVIEAGAVRFRPDSADRPGHHPGLRDHDYRSGVRRPGGIADFRHLRFHGADPGGHPVDVLPVAT
jgi:hypothetical protein